MVKEHSEFTCKRCKQLSVDLKEKGLSEDEIVFILKKFR